MPSPDLPPGFDFTDPDIYAGRLPVEELAHMRKVAPIWWNEQPKGVGAFGDGGYWVVTKHKDVKEVSRRSDVFSSNAKTALPRYRDDADPESLERGKVVLLNQGAPHHTHLRKIISRAFTPRAIECLREELDERAQNIVKAAAAEGSGDFVEQVSCELPLQAIAGLMGVPHEDRKKLFDWSNQMVGDQDPEFANNDPMAASIELIMYGMQMAAERNTNPGDVVPAHGARGHRAVGREDQEGSAGGDVLPFRELRRGRLRRSVLVQHSARSQPACGFWRHRRALLHRREPGPDDDRPDFQRDRQPDARSHADLTA